MKALVALNELFTIAQAWNKEDNFTPDFIENDPVQFPRAYEKQQDIEIAAFLASTIAWGNRKQILTGCRKMFHDIMKNRPFEFVISGRFNDIDPAMNIHRTFFGRDLVYMCRGLQFVYLQCNTLAIAFSESDSNVWDGFSRLRELFAQANGGEYSRHISNPTPNRHKGGSACKRLNLMLRWLCRQDGIVDMGIWHNLKPSELMIPLDTHVARIGREMGLIERNGNDRKTVEELTAKLRELDKNDPCKYDFALFGLGESQKRAKL